MLLLDINTSCSVIITSSATGQIHTLFLRRQANEELSIYKITYILNNSTEACLMAKTASCSFVSHVDLFEEKVGLHIQNR